MTHDPSPMQGTPVPPPDASLQQLLKDALDQSQKLARLEVELARQDITNQMATFKSSAALVGGGVSLVIVAIAMLFVGVLLALGATGVTFLAFGAALLVLGVAASYWAVKRLPVPAERTIARLKKDAAIFKEHVA